MPDYHFLNDSRRTSVLSAVLAYLGIIACVLWLHWDLFFKISILENSDYALNVLQVENAKTFSEWRGNYSRWGFHHPGPFFWYVFALAEWIFLKLTHLVPAAGNAHLLGFMLCAVGMAVAGIYWLSRGLRAPRAIIPLAIGSLPLFVGPEAWFSLNWPPLFPVAPLFLCATAAYALSRGNGKALPWLVLGSMVAVHSHVAQPFFVGIVLCYLAASFFLSPDKWMEIQQMPITTFAVSVLLAVILSFPLGYDALLWFRGESSSLGQIWQHMTKVHNPPHTWWSAVKYMHGFLDPDLKSSTAIHFLTAFLAGVVVVTNVGSVLSLMRGRFEAAQAQCAFEGNARHSGSCSIPERRRHCDVGSLACLSLALLFASLIWSKIQDGQQYAFNAYFIHGIFFLNFVAAVAATWSVMFQRMRWMIIAATAVLAGIQIRGFAQQDVISRHAYHAELVRRSAMVRGLLDQFAALRGAPPPPFIVFEIEKPAWELAAGLIADLKRRQIPFAVMPEWEFQYGPENGLRRLEYSGLDKDAQIAVFNISIWEATGGEAESEVKLTRRTRTIRDLLR